MCSLAPFIHVTPKLGMPPNAEPEVFRKEFVLIKGTFLGGFSFIFSPIWLPTISHPPPLPSYQAYACFLSNTWTWPYISFRVAAHATSQGRQKILTKKTPKTKQLSTLFCMHTVSSLMPAIGQHHCDWQVKDSMRYLPPRKHNKFWNVWFLLYFS